MATTSILESKSDKLARLLAAARESQRRNLEIKTASESNSDNTTENLTKLLTPIATEVQSLGAIGRDGNAISYNERQNEFIALATSGKSCILIGAAGTGKTTCTRGAMVSLIESGAAGILNDDGHKYISSGSPGIVAVSFTRRAVANLRRAMPDDMKNNTLTIHALLEYEPVYYTIITDEGIEKETMRFEPTRNAMRPLPASIKYCFIDESSMVSVELFSELVAALPNCIFIFLGDIQQLPPVFGSAVLGYKMLELPTVELTEVYRQALESPIIRLAHRILSGKPIPVSEFSSWKTPDQLTLHPWKKKLNADNACFTIAKFLTVSIENKLYNPDEDMVLIPFNKACGTIELNKHIAQFMARKRNTEVWEVIAGFNKHYFSVGDRVLYDKEDAIITEINLNGNYSGAAAQKSSLTLDYWGFDNGDSKENQHHINENETDDIDFLLGQVVALGGNDESDRVRQCSHVITVKMLDSETYIKVDTAADVNSLLLSYALTVHKSQGSEFRKVFLMLHQSHNTMLQRELLYTAVTRAKEELYVICEPDSFEKGILSQRIKGNTLEQKAEYFKGLQERKKVL